MPHNATTHGAIAIHPANGLGWNWFNGLDFDMDCVWVNSNGLY